MKSENESKLDLKPLLQAFKNEHPEANVWCKGEPITAVLDSDFWDSDDCRLCGVNNQATHAPWCEYRDGTPVADIDRMRIFSDWANNQIATLRAEIQALQARVKALESRNPANR